MRFNYPVIERHPNWIGGDEAKAAGAFGTGLIGGLFVASGSQRRFFPPVHYEIGTLRHAGVSVPQSLSIAIAQGLAQAACPDEGRVADDKIGVGPIGGGWFQLSLPASP